MSDEELARWAASFLALCEESPPILVESPVSLVATNAERAHIITPAAQLLLASVASGGVPAFMTSSLKQIALENGVALHEATTPNQIIDALREKCVDRATAPSQNFD